MRTLIAFLGMLAVSASVLVLPAHADDNPPPPPPGLTCTGGKVLDYRNGLWACYEETSTGPPGDGGSQGAVSRTCTWGGQVIDCSVDGAVWFDPPGCYARRADVGEETVALFGDPESGWVWQCSPDVSQGLAGWAGVPEGEEVFYVPDGETPVMDPAVIAARAVDRLPLAVPEPLPRKRADSKPSRATRQCSILPLFAGSVNRLRKSPRVSTAVVFTKRSAPAGA
jgi:hypothetical protein